MAKFLSVISSDQSIVILFMGSNLLPSSDGGTNVINIMTAKTLIQLITIGPAIRRSRAPLNVDKPSSGKCLPGRKYSPDYSKRVNDVDKYIRKL